MGDTDNLVAASKAGQLKTFRRQMGLKQWALADMLGVDQATVSRWESGKSPIDDRIWKNLVDIRKDREATSSRSVVRPGLDPDEHWPLLLKRYRAMQNLSQEELSEMLGCTPDSVSRWERGLFKPNLSTLIQLRNVIFSSADP